MPKQIRQRWRKWKKLNELKAEMEKEIKEHRDAIRHYLIKKKVKVVYHGEEAVKLIEPQSMVWDIDEVKKMIANSSVQRRAAKANIELDQAIVTIERVEADIIEDLLKNKVISRKQARKLFKLVPTTSYPRLGKLKEFDE